MADRPTDAKLLAWATTSGALGPRGRRVAPVRGRRRRRGRNTHRAVEVRLPARGPDGGAVSGLAAVGNSAVAAERRRAMQ
ncbi:hypothetical protein NDU88_006359 [Pleurodeles waltl]|uniref:Uncharacterized protein n=1 Tax=Pleurodeles waltl TaxID=8319 RepID=A0AAV7NT15_PLEWA|nr:hypothetical protein NDU88_006359 [Pleurodeles waltl]